MVSAAPIRSSLDAGHLSGNELMTGQFTHMHVFGIHEYNNYAAY